MAPPENASRIERVGPDREPIRWKTSPEACEPFADLHNRGASKARVDIDAVSLQ